MNDYWDRRAAQRFNFRGETFYTITPVPYYRSRRAWLLARVRERIGVPSTILDFGCGDGFYCRWAATTFPGVQVTGFDTSSGMVEYASLTKHDGVTFTTNLTDDIGRYDTILCFAVLAHVPEASIVEMASTWRRLANPNATVFVFEQTAERPADMADTRRLPSQYRDLFRTAGWQVTEELAYSRVLFSWCCQMAEYGHAAKRRLARMLGVEIPRNINSSRLALYVLDGLDRLTRAFDHRHRTSRANTLFVLK